jgi:hypothetical protein
LPVWELRGASDGEITSDELLRLGAKVFEAIRDAAIEFGITESLEWRFPESGNRVAPPEDIRWASLFGQPYTADECESLCAVLRDKVQSVREKIVDEPAAEARNAALTEYLSHLSIGAVVGYAPSTPQVLYEVSPAGEVCVYGTVVARPAGLYLTLMRLLQTCLPLPATERMALARPDRPDASLRETWIPNKHWGLGSPVGVFDAVKLATVLEGFRAANCQESSWQLGRRMSSLHSWANECCEDWAIAAAHFPDAAASSTKHVCGASGDQARLFGPSESCEHEDSGSRFEEPLLLVVSQLCDNAEAILADVVKDEGKGVFSGDIESDPEASQFVGYRREVARVKAMCAPLNLTSVQSMLQTAQQAAPDPADPAYKKLGTTRQKCQALTDKFAQAAALLDDARKVAYGELRLRALQWGEYGLESTALGGWAVQNDNIRAAITVAIQQLNNGMPPYVVLSQLAPVAEALVRKIAAKHLPEFHGLNAGAMLAQLRRTIGQGPDEHEVRATLSTAQALVSLRNWVVHDSEAEWGRDHAAFLLNGLSLMLRSV